MLGFTTQIGLNSSTWVGQHSNISCRNMVQAAGSCTGICNVFRSSVLLTNAANVIVILEIL